MFRILTSLIVLSTLGPTDALALDYDPYSFWRFADPSNPDADLRGGFRSLGDELVYNPVTGELIYNDVDVDGWFPPDVLSKSGLFITEVVLPPVLLHNEPLLPSNLEYQQRTPYWELDAEVDRMVLIGSTALRVNYDPYELWPRSRRDPEVLAAWGLSVAPAMHSYGRVLPPGLTKELLQQDLLSTTMASIVVVPEPNGLLLSLSLLAGVRVGCLNRCQPARMTQHKR